MLREDILRYRCTERSVEESDPFGGLLSCQRDSMGTRTPDSLVSFLATSGNPSTAKSQDAQIPQGLQQSINGYLHSDPMESS